MKDLNSIVKIILGVILSVVGGALLIIIPFGVPIFIFSMLYIADRREKKAVEKEKKDEV